MDIATPILLLASILLIISVIGSKASLKIGVPTLILFLVIGMAVGEDGLGIAFDNYRIAQFLGIVALNFILFSGGLETNIDHVKSVVSKGVSLATVGVFITTFVVAGFVYLVAHFSIIESILLGAIVSSTDAAAVFSIFRSRKMGLKRKLRDVIELESASNDPMAYFLTITLISLLSNPDPNYWLLAPKFILEMVLGAAVGLILGFAFVRMFNKLKLDIDGLYPVLGIAVSLFVYSLTTYFGGNGFLAVYLAAVVFGNSKFVHKRSLIMFYDGFAWLMQIVMFLSLGLLVSPSKMIPYAGVGLSIALFLMFVARPISVFISLAPFKMPFKDKLFVSWCGLRGAVPIVFATYPLIAGVHIADEIFQIVFYITVSSMLIQGTTFPIMAKWLGIAKKEPANKKFVFNDDDDFASELQEITIDNKDCDGKTIVELELPEGALIVYIKRKGHYVTPTGTSLVFLGDKLLILASDKKILRKTFNIVSSE